MAEIVIYTQPGCPYCADARALLSHKRVPFREINAPHGTPERAEAIARSHGRVTVPQIFINGHPIGGCDDLYALDQAGRLDALLAGNAA